MRNVPAPNDRGTTNTTRSLEPVAIIARAAYTVGCFDRGDVRVLPPPVSVQ